MFKRTLPKNSTRNFHFKNLTLEKITQTISKWNLLLKTIPEILIHVFFKIWYRIFLPKCFLFEVGLETLFKKLTCMKLVWKFYDKKFPTCSWFGIVL
jgi:hypothetical protein